LDTLERHSNADLLLLDLNLPGAYGFSAWPTCADPILSCP